MNRRCLLGLLVLAVGATAFAARYGPASYQPDYVTRDIYRPHVQRTYPPCWWKMKLLPDTKENPADDAGTVGKYCEPDFDDSGWADQVVAHPWNTALGESPRSAKNIGFEGVGWYRVEFRAPSNPARLRGIMHFEHVNTEATVYVNGKKAGFHKNRGGYWWDFELDVTELLRFGAQNTVAVRVFSRNVNRRHISHQQGGITGRVWLDLRPAVWCRHILVTPEEGLQGLRYDCVLDTAEPGTLAGWEVEVFEWNSGKIAATAAAGRVRRDNGRTFLTGRIAVPDAKPWSFRSPFLYGIRFRDAKGQLSGIQRFGMRTFTVRNGQFMLNGKPTFLHGCVVHAQRYGHMAWKRYMFQFNERGALYRYFKRIRDANINWINPHDFLRQSGYDVLDELGILCSDTLGYPTTPIKDPVSVVEIARHGIDGACEQDGTLRPSFIEHVTGRMYRSYSHPSMGTFAFGGEMRSYQTPKGRRTRAMMHNLYDLYRKLDLQNRPITPASGHFLSGGDWKGGGLRREGTKLDYIDTHDYTGSGVWKPIWDVPIVLDAFVAKAKKLWPEGSPPIVNGEGGGNWANYYSVYDPIWESEDDPDADIEALKKALAYTTGRIGIRSTMLYGSKAYKYRRPEQRAWHIERIFEHWRKRWPDTDGFSWMSGSIFTAGIRFPLERNAFDPNPAYEPIKQLCAPLVIVLDYLPPNRYVGDVLDLNMVVVNNDERDYDGLRAVLTLRDQARVVWHKTVPVGTLQIGEKAERSVQMQIPPVPEGRRLTFEYAVRDKSRLRCRRLLYFNVRNRRTVFAPLRAARTVKLYEPEPSGAAGLLKAFGLPCQTVSRFDGLVSRDLLVIGPDCMDGRVNEAADRIRAFVEAGGRLLVLRQHAKSPHLKTGKDVPLNPGSKVLNSVFAHFSEMLRMTHPFVRGMTQHELHCWNHPTYAIYRNIVTPLSDNTVLLGGNMYQRRWGPDTFGSVLADVPVGKGRIIFCQALVDECFEQDSGAARLARNILETAVRTN